MAGVASSIKFFIDASIRLKYNHDQETTRSSICQTVINMHLISVFVILSLCCHHAIGHMVIALPSVWGLTSDLENPLNSGTSNWFCHGRSRDTTSVTTLNAGQSISVPIVCGEAIDNPSQGGSTCSNDVAAYHNGGGCALSIAYKSNPTSVGDFTMFTVNHDCPKVGQAMINFAIPANLPNGDAVCSWTWIPDPSMSADEMYMNCFNCRVVSGSSGSLIGGTPLSQHIFAVNGAPASSGRPMYRSVLPNGALALQVNGGQTQGNSTSTTIINSVRSTTVRSRTTRATRTTRVTSQQPTSTMSGQCNCQSCQKSSVRVGSSTARRARTRTIVR